MRTRLVALTLGLFLFLILLDCNRKPADSTAANDNSTTPSSGSEKSASSEMSNTKSPVKTEIAKPLVVPAGTVLTVRLGQAVGSKISSPGQTFSATVVNPVEIDGKTAIPAGASASGTVVDAKPLGRFKGGAVLQLRLSAVTVRGAERPVSTSSLVRTEKGKGKRTAVVTGGGAAVGALIGGLAGGGKGAAIGAGVGAGGGLAASGTTGGKNVEFPAESRITFKLTEPVTIER